MTGNRKGYVVGAVAGAGLSVAVLAAAGFDLPQAFAQSPAAQPGSRVFSPPPGAPMSFADIIDRVSPAVVSIDVKGRADPRSALPRGFEGFPFDLLPQRPPRGQGQPGQPPQLDDLPETQSSGSGFFISPEGYIVTNNHVVENATEITVTLKDERELKARVVGRDEATDLAVLKVDGGPFPYVTFENAAVPRVGDWVVALGNPFGLGGTATAGIVSAYGRDIGEQFTDFIQIDAPINRGNSGGPTFDLYGRVIGVNTQILSSTGGSIGIGFAIPADIADEVTKQLIRDGRIERGYLGVSIGDVTRDIQESLGLRDRNGAYVSDVTSGGPAARAGLQPNDIIVRLNGEPVKNNSDLSRRVARAKPGDVLRLEVLRNGRTVRLEARSGRRPSEQQLAQADGGAQDGPNATPPAVQGVEVLGMEFAPLTPDLRRRYGYESDVQGVVVIGVAERSEADRRGFRAGFVVTLADGRPVTTPAELQRIVAELRAANRPSILLLVKQPGRAGNTPAIVPLK
jgi:serine protease Do